MNRLIFLCLALICSSPIGAFAHHSLAAYRTSIYMTTEGTVKSFNWSNPHVQLVLVVAGPDGAKEWAFEGPAISRLAANGFRKSMVALGDKVKVEYNPRNGGGIGGLFIGITTADGRNHSIVRLRER